ncbi:MAG: S-layer homology domain-containing protein, partial [Thermoanaerobaculum sp.]|nr:S-layer homology domain-containing protein [Thermoanaerobaculum sp.]
ETGYSVSMAATTPGQDGLADGGVAAVQNGTAAWRNYTAAKVNLNYGGVQPRNLDCGQGNYNGQVWFNDPCNQIADLSFCSGILAWGGSYFSTTPQTYDGQVWYPGLAAGSFGPFVVVNNGAQCVGPTNFAEMMTHELGHALFFGHHTDPNAVMYFSCCRGGGAQIYTTDKICASNQYHTFLDVPYAHWAWSYIEGVEDAGVTTGCGGGNFCPNASVTRAQMAVFLLKGKHGSFYVPANCVGLFSDVPCPSYWAVNWIEALANEGITSGCGGGKYCPETSVTRAQMAVFLLKAKYGSSYVPPPCTGIFSDVPCPGHWAAAWIEALAAEGITSGCGGGQYCPQNPVTRAQMAVFLVRAFSLPRP